MLGLFLALSPFIVVGLGLLLAKITLRLSDAYDARARSRRGYSRRPVQGDNIVGRDRGKLEEGVLLRSLRRL